MNDSTFDALAGDAVADLLGGVGSAMPGPLFLVDAAGRAHALNGLAREQPHDDPAAEAFMSPVVIGSEPAGHVVGYVRHGGPSADAALVAALVALAAQALSRRLGGESSDVPDLGATDPRPARPEDVIEAARRRLTQAASERMAADIVVEAADAALGARSTVLHVTGADGRLEPIARRGVESVTDSGTQRGHGLLGWAADRPCSTAVRSLVAMPADAPRCTGSRCAVDAWLVPPFAIVPIRVGPELLGVLSVAGLPRRPGVDVAAVAAAHLEKLADKAAASIAGARMLDQVKKQERVAHEIEIARQIQRSLLPHGSLAFQGLELAGECRPASRVGGDYFGFRTQGGRLTATLFDVAGHGVGAAFCMTLVRSVLNGEIARGGTPSEVLTSANGLAWEDLSESALYATAFLARFDRDRGILEYSSAGHAPPIAWRAAERCFVDLPEGGLPLGLFADGAFPGGEVAFAPGDLLVLYTDGFVDAENASGEKFGRSRLLAAVHRSRRRPAREVLRRLWRELGAFVGDQPMRDDATLVVVRGGEAFGRVERPARRGREDRVEKSSPCTAGHPRA